MSVTLDVEGNEVMLANFARRHPFVSGAFYFIAAAPVLSVVSVLGQAVFVAAVPFVLAYMLIDLVFRQPKADRQGS